MLDADSTIDSTIDSSALQKMSQE